MKTCFKCKTEKPIAEFYRHPQMADGHLGKCKECTKADSRMRGSDPDYERRRAMLPHRVALRARYQQTEAGRAAVRRGKSKWLSSNPMKRAAHNLINSAIKAGKIAKPSTCSECGKGGRIHGHHDDYSKQHNPH